MAGEDDAYTRWVRKQPCSWCMRPGPNECHHHTEGQNAVAADRGPKHKGGKRGLGQRAHDHESMPMCIKCHHNVQTFSGPFAGMSKAERARWQDEQVKRHRAEYDDTLERQPAIDEAKRERVAAESGPFLPEGVGFDPGAFAECFANYYSLAPAVRHDLVRLLKRTARETKGS
jgi:hypothetical protein